MFRSLTKPSSFVTFFFWFPFHHIEDVDCFRFFDWSPKRMRWQEKHPNWGCTACFLNARCIELILLFARYENAAASSDIVRLSYQIFNAWLTRLTQIGKLCGLVLLKFLWSSAGWDSRVLSTASMLSGFLCSLTPVASLFLRRSDPARLTGLTGPWGRLYRGTPGCWFGSRQWHERPSRSNTRLSLFANPLYRQTPCTESFSLLPPGISFSASLKSHR